MTDRIKGYVVVLEENIREDDAEEITKAIGLIKGVLTVTPVKSGVEDIFIQERVRRDLLHKVFDLIKQS